MTTSRSERNPGADRDDDGDVVRPDRVRDKEESTKEAAERLDEIHQYLSDRYRRRDVIAQTRTAEGLQLDWVPLESLAGGNPADPPDEDRPLELPEGERAAEAVRFELEDERAKRGPAGTVDDALDQHPGLKHKLGENSVETDLLLYSASVRN
jgi:hypothetical protein